MSEFTATAAGGPRCAGLSRLLGEPLAGTSALASTWLCIEQPGPWGRDALVQSHIDGPIGRELADRARGTGVRVVLIRRAGSHPDRHRPIPHRVYLAHTRPGRTWLERASVADPKELLDLDLAALGAGVPSGLGELVTESLLLVCTNGRRDVCCALLGRPVAAELARTHGDRVWECSHIGGHRFSPTAVSLPTGYSYGRLDAGIAARLLTDPGVLVEHCRGRSTWPAATQVAELAVRAAVAEPDPDALRPGAEEPAGPGRTRIVVTHRDSRRWSVDVAARTEPDARSASCGAAPKPATVLRAELVRDLFTEQPAMNSGIFRCSDGEAG